MVCSDEEIESGRRIIAYHLRRDLPSLCGAKAACFLSGAWTGFGVRDGSFLSLLSVGRSFLHPIGVSAFGRLNRPPLASQLVHSFETIRTTFGRLRWPSRRRSSMVNNPSRAASRMAF